MDNEDLLGDAGQRPPRALSTTRTRLAVLAVAALVLAADQVSKSIVMAVQPAGQTGGLITVRLVHNNGASFGIGAGHPLVVTLTAIVVLAAAVVLLALTRNRAAALALGAVVGGAAGNLADRLLRGPGLGSGAVVDWIHVAFYPATFNIADIAIRAGALVAVLAVLIPQRRRSGPRADVNEQRSRTPTRASRSPLPGRHR